MASTGRTFNCAFFVSVEAVFAWFEAGNLSRNVKRPWFTWLFEFHGSRDSVGFCKSDYSTCKAWNCQWGPNIEYTNLIFCGIYLHLEVVRSQSISLSLVSPERKLQRYEVLLNFDMEPFFYPKVQLLKKKGRKIDFLHHHVVSSKFNIIWHFVIYECYFCKAHKKWNVTITKVTKSLDHSSKNYLHL